MYIVEGNIGAGKSTFLTLIQKHISQISIALEPLHNWQKQVYGQSLLANFYQEPQRWAYTLETLAMTCRVREHVYEQQLEQQHSYVRLIERSVYSGHYCFAHNSYASSFMNKLEWKVYNHWFSFLIPGKCKKPQGFIYLKVDPEIAYRRIKKRNRLSEKKLTLAYLRLIDKRHEDFLIHKANILPELLDVPVLTIDCNKEFEENPIQLKKHLQLLQTFIAQNSLKKNSLHTQAQLIYR